MTASAELVNRPRCFRNGILRTPVTLVSLDDLGPRCPLDEVLLP